MTASSATNATMPRASLIALLIITPSRIPMMNVVTESTGIRGYTGEKSQEDV